MRQCQHLLILRLSVAALAAIKFHGAIVLSVLLLILYAGAERNHVGEGLLEGRADFFLADGCSHALILQALVHLQIECLSIQTMILLASLQVLVDQLGLLVHPDHKLAIVTMILHGNSKRPSPLNVLEGRPQLLILLQHLLEYGLLISALARTAHYFIKLLPVEVRLGAPVLIRLRVAITVEAEPKNRHVHVCVLFQFGSLLLASQYWIAAVVDGVLESFDVLDASITPLLPHQLPLLLQRLPHILHLLLHRRHLLQISTPPTIVR